MENTIWTQQQNRTGRITFHLKTSNRPIDIDLLQTLHRDLARMAEDESIDLVIMDRAATARDFCASQGAKTLSLAGRYIGDAATKYLETYLRICHLIATYPKPIVSIIDGATVAESAGFALLSSHQVVTERARLWFPETSFGSIPSAGASRILSRLEGEIGAWLVLTGARLSGADIYAAGLATHYSSSNNLSNLISALQNSGLHALDACHTDREFSFEEHRAEINHVFSGKCANQIKFRLERGSTWAKSQATKFAARSPLSIKIALRLLRTSEYLDSTREALKLEYRALSRLVQSRNFREGVRAAFEDMDYWPAWKPNSVFNVTYDMVSEYFTPLRDGELDLTDKARLKSRLLAREAAPA
ncbi:MAG: enoyl-CoA hydratase/isomerase family protein [Pseudomonadota bacterium]